EPLRAVRVAAAGLALAALAAAWAISAGAGWSAFLGVVAVEILFSWTQRAAVRGVRDAVDRPARELRKLAELLARFEREPFAAPRLREIRKGMERSGHPP